MRYVVPRLAQIHYLLALLLVFSFAWLTPQTSSAGVNAWTSNGPYGGTVLSLAIDPFQPEVMYAGTRYGGVFKSTDGGANWFGINEGLNEPSEAQFETLLLNPSNPAMIYALTAGPTRREIFKTTDAGSTWALIYDNTHRPLLCLTIDPSHPETMYAGMPYGVLKSVDGGTTWSIANSSVRNISAIAVDPTSPLTIYAATGQQGLLKSLDGGITWGAGGSGIPFGPFFHSIVVDPSSPKVIYAVSNSGIYMSIDGATSWSRTSSLFLRSLIIDPIDPLILFGAGDSGMVKSADRGATWVSANEGLGPTSGMALVLQPGNSRSLVAGTSAGIFRSTDAATSWFLSSDGLTATVVEDLAITPGDTATIYAATTSSGVFKSNDSGATWTPVNSGLTNLRMRSLVVNRSEPGTVLSGGAGIFKTTDGASSWALSEGDAFVLAFSSDPVDHDTTYAGSSGGRVFKTADGGSSWIHHEVTLPWHNILDLEVDPLDSQTVYAGSFGSGIFTSHDGGVSWANTSSGLTSLDVTSLIFDAATPGRLFAGTLSGGSTHPGGLFKSSDSGSSWVDITQSPLNRSIETLALDATSPDTIYAGISGGIARSLDGGTTWSLVNIGIPNYLEPGARSFAVAPGSPSAVYAGRAGGVFSLTQGVDLSLAISGSEDPVVAGGAELVYEVRATNFGPSEASEVEISVALVLPAGVSIQMITTGGTSTYAEGLWTLPGLPALTSETLTVTLRVGAETEPGTDVITTMATLETVVEPVINPGDDSATESTSVIAEADLAVSLADSPDPVMAGAALTYTLTVINLGPSRATGVEVVDLLPLDAAFVSSSIGAACSHSSGTVTCALGGLDPGLPSMVEIVTAVDSGASGTLVDQATVSTLTPDPEPGNDLAQATTTVLPSGPGTVLTFVEVVRDGVGGVDGLDFANHIAVSPDGAYVYVAAQNDNAVAVFSRDAGSGELTFIEVVRDGVGGIDGLAFAVSVTVSPDGAHVYATSPAVDNAVAVFARDPVTGQLTQVEVQRDGVGGVDGLQGAWFTALSPDGSHLYVAGQFEHKIAIFERDQATGELTFVGVVTDGVDGVDGLFYITSVALDSTGSHLYASGSVDDKVAVFSRNPATGALTFVEVLADGIGGVDGVEGVTSVIVTRDGQHVYATGSGEDAVTRFERDPATGELTFVEALRNGIDGPTALDYPTTLALDPLGRYLFVPSLLGDSLALLERNRRTGELTFVEEHLDDINGVDGLSSASAAAVSPDGRHLYVASRDDDAVAVFAIPSPVIFTDGFESGDTTAWSASHGP